MALKMIARFLLTETWNSIEIGISMSFFVRYYAVTLLPLLPPANEVCEGYVFTRVCLSTGGRESTWAGTPGVGTPPRPGTAPGPGTPTPPGTSPRPGTPPDQVHPLPDQVHPQDQVHPLPEQVPPRTRYPWTRYTPPGTRLGTPPGAVYAGRYGQQAGGTHPTGMHSCYVIIVIIFKFKTRVDLTCVFCHQHAMAFSDSPLLQHLPISSCPAWQSNRLIHILINGIINVL